MSPPALTPLLQERLQDLLQKALITYGLEPPRQVHFFIKPQTFLFCIHTDSAVFALKIYPRQHPQAERLPEILNWIAQVSDSPEHRFLKALPNRQHTFLSPLCVKQQHWVAVLYPWVSGQSFPEQLTPQHLSQWGSLLGAFHAQSARFKDKSPRSRLNTWDTVFYAAESDRLMTSAFWKQLPGTHLHLKTDYQRWAHAVQDTLHTLWQDAAPPLRIHGDMQGPNIICQTRQWTLLDFDDLTWGYPIQDISISLLPLRPHPQFKNLCSHFKTGYQRLFPWPEAHEIHLDTLMTGRLLVLADALLDDTSLAPTTVLEHWVRYGEKIQALQAPGHPTGLDF